MLYFFVLYSFFFNSVLIKPFRISWSLCNLLYPFYFYYIFSYRYYFIRICRTWFIFSLCFTMFLYTHPISVPFYSVLFFSPQYASYTISYLLQIFQCSFFNVLYYILRSRTVFTILELFALMYSRTDFFLDLFEISVFLNSLNLFPFTFL